MLFSVEQAFVGRDEERAPLKTTAWEANPHLGRKLLRNFVNEIFNNITEKYVGSKRNDSKRYVRNM